MTVEITVRDVRRSGGYLLPFALQLTDRAFSDVPTYSDADFEDSRFDYGERVRILLRHPKLGGVYGEAEGTCAAREEDVEFEARDGTMRTKTLVWLKDIEGYEKPHEDLPDTTQEVQEAWFAEEALRKKEGDPLDGVSFN